MTVSSTTTKNSYSGNGSNDTFAYGFKIFDDDDITVIIRTDATGTETVKTKTTHYTVTNVGNASGGNVVFTGGNIPASGETVVLRRTSAQTQTTDYVANDPFPAATHEDALDKLTFLAQEQQEELDRAIKISRTNTMTSTEFTVGATDRANKVLAFDSSGEIQVTQEIGTFRGNWAASTAYQVRDLVKDTSTNNIFIVNAAHTSSGAQPLTTNANSAKYDLIVDAATATTSATAAASSATAAASSATAAAASETAAATSETNAATSATTATTKASEASTSATNAASSATTATTKASEASTSATNAATSQTNAATSATAAAASATAAAASETAAGTSETNAATSASTATTKASEAATSATSAATSASTATTKASEASTSATNAASSATAAAASQTSAAASAASAASAFDNFDDTYLGSKTSNPTVDNDGDALVAGALYFNSTANEMRVYDGANWIAATSAGNVSLILYEYTATSNQTTFSGSDDNSATLSYTVDNLQVVMNGIVLDPSDFTATNGTSVVLATGAAANDVVNIYAFKSFTTADMVSKTNGGTFAGAVTFDAGANFGDNDKAQFGAGNDLQIYHDGSNSYIQDTATGQLLITTQGAYIALQKNLNETMAQFIPDGSVDLYHDNSKKFATTSTGVDVTGVITTDGLSTSADISVADNIKAKWGTGNDLHIYHDGADSYIQEHGSGSLYIGADSTIALTNAAVTTTKAQFITGGAVKLFHNNAQKFETTSTGVEVGDSSGGQVTFRYTGNSGFGAIKTDSNSALSFSAGATSFSEKMSLDSGSLGVGISAASASGRIHVSEPNNRHAGFIHNTNASMSNPTLQVSTSRNTTNQSYNHFRCSIHGVANKMAVMDSGDVLNSNNSYGQLSDQRMKENIVDAASQWDDIKALQVRKFNFIGSGLTQIGVVAQELETAGMDGLISEAEWFDVDANPDNEVRKSVKYSVLYMKAIKALQEAMTRIETLETKVAALESGS